MRRTVLVGAMALLNGCAFTTMLPAHKLDKHQTVVQLALDEPGFLFVPRLSGQVTLGTGWADFGFHAGTTAFNVNGGGTARLYLGKWALSIQGDMMITTFEDSLFSGGTRFGFITANPRFGRLLVSSNEHFYAGFQLLGIVPFNIDETADLPSRPGLAAGAYLGYAWDSPGNLDVQFELSAAPVATFPGLYTEDESYGVGVAPIAQIGIALQYRKEKPPPAPPSTRPPQPRSGDPDPIR